MQTLPCRNSFRQGGEQNEVARRRTTRRRRASIWGGSEVNLSGPKMVFISHPVLLYMWMGGWVGKI